MKDSYDLIVIGGGPAGMAAALSAHENGIQNILLVESGQELGGILNQCIHSGFGLDYLGRELTGPEYAEHFSRLVYESEIELCLNCNVLEIKADKSVCLSGSRTGYRVINAKAVVLAVGCRERVRGAIGIPGTRPEGIITAGTLQKLINVDGFPIHLNRVLILGSGDVGLIMARRLTLEGVKVLACVEHLPVPSGLARNVSQCLNDFNIPLCLSHTVTEIRGTKRLEQVVVSALDGSRQPVLGSEIVFDCDTLLLSAGLIPETELLRKIGISINPLTSELEVKENYETVIPGIFVCGNALYVHDLADSVTTESIAAGKAAADYLKGISSHSGAVLQKPKRRADIKKAESETGFSEVICVVCPKQCKLRVYDDLSVKGNQCPRGEEYGKRELEEPVRLLTASVSVRSGKINRCPVKTNAEIPKELLLDAALALKQITLEAPVKSGQIVIQNLLGTGCEVVTTRSVEKA